MIIDDEQYAIDVLVKYINNTPGLMVCGVATDPLKGLAQLAVEKPDLLFLDIQMDQLNGVEFKKIIDHTIGVVFCTGYIEFAVAGFELGVIDYLMKPILYSRFLKAVQRYQIGGTYYSHPLGNTLQMTAHFYVKAEYKGKMVKIEFSKIDYVEARGNYISICSGSEQILVYLSIKELEKQLPVLFFMRVHKSYIVSLERIAAFDSNSVLIKQQLKRIPIGHGFKDAFLKRVKPYFI